MAQSNRIDEQGWPRNKHEIRNVQLCKRGDPLPGYPGHYCEHWCYHRLGWSAGPWRDWQEAGDERQWKRWVVFMGSKNPLPEFEPADHQITDVPSDRSAYHLPQDSR